MTRTSPSTIYLIRHGETEFNASRRVQGALDSQLTALGVEQAGRVGRLLVQLVRDPAGCPIVCSPQERAHRTARIIAEAMGARAPVTDGRLREISLGSWDGKTYEEIEAGWPGTFSTGGMWFFTSPDGERYEQMSARLAHWLEDARTRPGEQVVVSHGVAGRILRGLVLGLSREETMMLSIPQDAVFRLWRDQVDCIECDPP